jgi:hypothetical protein
MTEAKEKEYIFRELRKLVDVLSTWGNVLVNPIEGQQETTAQERLKWLVDKAKSKYGMTLDDVEAGIEALEAKP